MREAQGRKSGGVRLAGVLLLAVGSTAGCGYHLIGVSSNLPPNIKTLYVAPFVNQTARAELDQRLAEQVTQEWVRRGRFELVSTAEKADAVLNATVLSAVVAPVQFDSQGRATEYQLTVVADAQFVDRTGEKPVVLWRDQHFTRSVSYQVDVNATNYFDREIVAIEDISRDFARGLVVSILEGF